MAHIVGLDIGTKTLTGAVFSGSAKKFRLVDFFTEEIETLQSGDYREDGEYVAPLSSEELLAKVIEDHGLKNADIVTSIDAKDCVIREINVPFTRDEQIRKTVFFEAENHFTGFDLEDAVLEYLKIDEIGDKSRLIVAALRNDLIEDRLSICRGAGIDPVSIDMDACALFNSFTITPMFDSSRTSLVVDMGTTSTKILLVENGELRKIRSLRLETLVGSPSRMIAEPATVGGDGPTVNVDVIGGEAPPGFGDFSIEGRFEEIESALRLLDPGPESEEGSPIAILSDDEFDRVRLEAEDELDELDLGDETAENQRGGGDTRSRGGDVDDGTQDYTGRFPGQSERKEFDYREYLERVGVEIQRSLAGARLDSPIELICLTGGMSDREEARRFFTDEFDVETVAFDFGDRIPSDAVVSRSVGDQVGGGDRLGTAGAVAVGLALKGLGHDRLEVDFRKGRFRYEHKFERVKLPLVAASFLLFVLFLQATFWAFRDWKEESKRLDKYQQQSRQTYEEFFGEAPKSSNPLAMARAKKKAWESGGAGEIPRFVEFIDSMNSFSEAMRSADLGHFEINSMVFKYRIKSVRSRSSSTGTRKKTSTKNLRPDTVPDATVVFETEDPSVSAKVTEAFDKDRNKTSGSPGLFQATPVEKKTGDKLRVTLKLKIPPDRLKQY